MIKIRLESNGDGKFIATGRTRRLPIGHQVEFTLPDGSVLSCITVGSGAGSCKACPFSWRYNEDRQVCPICSYSGLFICPNGGYIVKASSVMEDL